MPRFVVLRHECPAGYVRPSHWDFMLEAEGVLRTWALPDAPGAGEAMTAEALDDHRLEYLDYEGPLSGDRGAVTRWDQGTYEFEREEGKIEQEAGCRLVVVLCGDRLSGRATLTRQQGDDQRWSFAFSDV